ncbi:hypothetical protein Nepgr_011576 [Nepenthes gracilis]|uniref:Uncharacterized protein n=1 Tax=Nepenthes gracilis TaxID=150966 RepID=A0AAD3XMF8_NEPGR|nr:hypothetical protein Nepgr_011576 [Nepenthes gracilis]
MDLRKGIQRDTKIERKLEGSGRGSSKIKRILNKKTSGRIRSRWSSGLSGRLRRVSSISPFLHSLLHSGLHICHEVLSRAFLADFLEVTGGAGDEILSTGDSVGGTVGGADGVLACWSWSWPCLGGADGLLSSGGYGLELLDLLEWLFTPCWKQLRCWNLSVMQMANMVLLLKVLKICPVEDASGCLEWFLGFCCDG